MGDLYRCDLNLTICDEFGDYLKPNSVSAKMAQLLQGKLGLPKGYSLHNASAFFRLPSAFR